jgi:hypothetical protein
VRYYGNTHAYSTVTSYGLWNDFDTVSGQDLAWFFKPWVFGIGYPKDTIVWSKQSAGAAIAFHQVKYNDTTNFFRLAIPVKGSTKSGLSKVDTIWMDSTQTSTATATFGFQPDTVIFDPDGLLLWRIVKSTEVAAGVIPSTTSLDGLTLGIFPNPDNKQIIEIELNCSRPLGDVVLLICDESGKTLRTEDFSVNDTHVDRTTSLSGLTNGNYILIARSQNEQVSQKITLAQ